MSTQLSSPARRTALAAGVLLLLTSIAWSASADPLRIIGGRRATQAETYATVVIGDEIDGLFEPTCTGTLVAPDLVVTATHCVVDIDEETDEVLGVLDAGTMLVGVNILDAYNDDGDFYEVDELIPNMRFPNPDDEPIDETGLGEEDDIALIWLTEDVVGVEPVPILPSAAVSEALAPGSPIIITGYGLTEADNDDSAGVLHIAEVFVDGLGPWEFSVEGGGEVDSCQGDSGGPGYVEWDGDIYLVGASSRGVENSDRSCGDGGIYTLVPAFQTWMAQMTDGEFDPADTGAGDGPAAGAGGGGSDGGCSASGLRPSAAGAKWLLGAMALLLVGVGLRGRR